MAGFLQSVLNIKEPLFDIGIKSLEKATGNSGVDIRLIADITEKAHIVMRKLGLDVSDTTGHELYFALRSSVKRGEADSLLIDTDYVLLMIDGEIVSFNLIDVIENSHHEIPFNHQITSHGQRSLCGELVERYINHPRTDEAAMRHIAGSMGLTDKNGVI